MSDWMGADSFQTQFSSEEDFNGPVPRPDEYPEDPAKSLSYWIREHDIDLDRTWADKALPEVVDVVVIGSGITGAAVLYHLQEKHPNLRIALLEARGFCTGATGRNGGHICRPEVYQVAKTAEEFGDEEAIKMKKFGIKNRDMMLDAIDKLDAVEKTTLRVNGTVIVFETAEERDNFSKDLEYAKGLGYEPEGYLVEPEEAVKKFGFAPSLCSFGAAYIEKSGTIYPRKFVHVLLLHALDKMPNLTIHPYTPVEAVTKDNGASGLYKVRTTKCTVKARAIFHATNAYAGNICADLKGSNGVFGSKAHMLGVNPNVPGCTRQLDVGFGYGDFWHYLQQRPNRGPFLYGFAVAELLNNYDDTITLPDDHPIRPKMFKFLEDTFPEWFQNIDQKRDTSHDWTGIQGFTMTGASIVGRPSKDSPGEFASVGHNGEGMGRCFASAAVATDAMLAYLDGKDYTPPDWFPACFRRNI